MRELFSKQKDYRLLQDIEFTSVTENDINGNSDTIT